jgi:ribonuclease HI
MKSYIVTCDASYQKDANRCGWAAIIESEDGIRSISGRGPSVDNSESAELLAVVAVLREFDEPSEILIRADNKSLCRLPDKIEKFAARNFMKTRRKIMKDYELLKSFLVLNRKHQIEIHHVKGHSVDALNNMVHRMAFAARVGKQI